MHSPSRTGITDEETEERQREVHRVLGTILREPSCTASGRSYLQGFPTRRFRCIRAAARTTPRTRTARRRLPCARSPTDRHTDTATSITMIKLSPFGKPPISMFGVCVPVCLPKKKRTPDEGLGSRMSVGVLLFRREHGLDTQCDHTGSSAVVVVDER